MEEPLDGERADMPCDGCGNSIPVTWDAPRHMWVGEYVVTTTDLILHPACVQPDDSLDQENADLFAAYLKTQVGA